MFILAPLVIGGIACFIGIIGLITFVANFVSGYRCVFRRCGPMQCVHVVEILYALLVLVAGGYEYMLVKEYGNKLDNFFEELACSEALCVKVTTWHGYQKWLIRTMGLLAFILLLLIVTGSCLDDQLKGRNDEYEPTGQYDPMAPKYRPSKRKSESMPLYSSGANQPAESVR